MADGVTGKSAPGQGLDVEYERASIFRALCASIPQRASLALAGLAALWLTSQILMPWRPLMLGWLIVVAAVGVSLREVWGVVRMPGLEVAIRRFWRMLCLCLALIVPAVLSNAYDATVGPGAPTQVQGPTTIALYIAGICCIGWAVLTLPMQRSSGRHMVTLSLDMAIVVIAGGLLGYRLVATEGIAIVQDGGSPVAVVAIATVGCAALVALVRVALSGAGLLDRPTLWILGGTLSAGVIGGGLGKFLTPWPEVNDAEIVIPLCCVGITAAAFVQRARASAPRSIRPRSGRSGRFSLLPYVAVAVTDATLLVDSAHPGSHLRVFIIGSVVLTMAVVVRQLLVFADHARLLVELDASMLDLSNQEQRFRSLVQHSSDVIMITDQDGAQIYASPGLDAMFGTSTRRWSRQHLLHTVHPDDAGAVNTAMTALQTPGTTARFQSRVRHADGSWRWLELVCTNRFDDPSVGGLVTNARDVTETRRYQDELAYQASHDALTALANRSLFATETQRAVQRAEVADVESADGPSNGLAIVLIDLDDFKAINDHLGHGVGDALLLSVAARLRGCVRPSDLVARLGGDEFAVLLVDAPEQVAIRIAEAMISALSMPASAAGHDLVVQASIGLARREPGCDAAELLRRADVAMYAAKELGKGCYAEYRIELDSHAVENARLAAELRQAIDNNELHLEYQPIVALPNGALTGVEALVRWNHPTRGAVPPDLFVPVAERTGIIVPLGAWVLYEACRQAAEWQSVLGAAAPSRISVNVSARQLVERTFPQVVAAALHTVGLEASRLVVEITETAVFNGGRALQAVRELHNLGVAIALDDFGTGHSSLGVLRSCPVDILKVDKSFVDGVTGTLEQEAIATSVSQIAQAMRLEVVAEGVETAAQADRLYELGYRLAQGFHFARPMRAAEIERHCWSASRNGDQHRLPAA
jgi:diguanylate cyclase (GGDEF)-like protein/PAS domain S-box-containing protein